MSYNSSFWLNQLPSPSWRRVIQPKSRQELVFDPGGSTGRFCACPFFGTWRALLCRKVIVRGLDEAAACFWRKGDSGVINLEE